MSGMRGRGILSGTVALAALGGLVFGAHPAIAAAPRRVVGTVEVSGDVEAATVPQAWRPLAPGAFVDGSSVRTGSKGAVVLALATGDVVGIGQHTTCTVDGNRIVLASGHIALRLRTGSPLAVATPRGIVREQAFILAAASSDEEALVIVEGDVTTIQSYRGAFEILTPNGRTTPVLAGQVATFGAGDETPTIVPAAATIPAATADLGPGNNLAAIALPFGISPVVASVVAGGVVVGGTIGGVAASGGFSGGSSEPSPTQPQASPFRPIRRR